MLESERKRLRLPKHCECGGKMLYEVDFGRVFSCCDTCTPVVEVKVPKINVTAPVVHVPCCSMMKAHLNKTCEQHDSPYDCDCVIVGPPLTKWGLPVHDGGHSRITINFCPFCGTKLP